MEMKQIPDYPNYAVTRDGRVWSYIENKMVKLMKGKTAVRVALWCEGIRFDKIVARLVFEAFNGYTPECVVHRDRDVYNNSLDNLIGMTRSELSRKAVSKTNSKRTQREICRVNPDTGEVSFVKYKPHSTKYRGALRACYLIRVTYRGDLYFYPEKKFELVEEIKARIKQNNYLLSTGIPSPEMVKRIKRYNLNYKKYLEVLQTI